MAQALAPYFLQTPDNPTTLEYAAFVVGNAAGHWPHDTSVQVTLDGGHLIGTYPAQNTDQFTIQYDTTPPGAHTVHLAFQAQGGLAATLDYGWQVVAP